MYGMVQSIKLWYSKTCILQLRKAWWKVASLEFQLSIINNHCKQGYKTITPVIQQTKYLPPNGFKQHQLIAQQFSQVLNWLSLLLNLGARVISVSLLVINIFIFKFDDILQHQGCNELMKNGWSALLLLFHVKLNNLISAFKRRLGS